MSQSDLNEFKTTEIYTETEVVEEPKKTRKKKEVVEEPQA